MGILSSSIDGSFLTHISLPIFSYLVLRSLFPYIMYRPVIAAVGGINSPKLIVCGIKRLFVYYYTLHREGGGGRGGGADKIVSL